jgi:TetR/AcrR family transcriptional regulator
MVKLISSTIKLNHMTKKEKLKTEEKILDAAKKVFVEKGKAGARMQEIADEAGINKSLLHYYYRSKEKLFGAVFKFAFSKFAPKMINIFDTDKDIFEVIEFFVNNYIDLIRKNPFIPMFILNEINKKETSFVTDVIKDTGINVDKYIEFVQKYIDQGIIKDIDPRQLVVNIISLCIFPIVGRPVIQIIAFNDDKKAYENFLDTRKKEVTELIINSIKVQ